MQQPFILDVDTRKRFHKNIKRSNGHWYWTGKDRYFPIKSRWYPVLILAYQIKTEQKLDRKLRLHRTCRDRACINPDHYRVVPKDEYLGTLIQG